MDGMAACAAPLKNPKKIKTTTSAARDLTAIQQRIKIAQKKVEGNMMLMFPILVVFIRDRR